MAELWADPGLDAERRARTAVLDELRGDGLDPVAWALAPHVAVGLGRPHPGSLRAIPERARRTTRAVASAFVRSSGPRLCAVGPFTFVSTSAQNWRVLEPLAEAVAALHGPPADRQLPVIGARVAARAIAEARAASAGIAGALRAAGLAPPADLLVEAVKGAVFRRRAAAGLASADVVVVATQHNVVTRAVLAGLGPATRTAYVPHAPTATNVAYQDLPVSHALLRGEADADVYARLGADRGRLLVVGDPDGRALAPGAGGEVTVLAAPVAPIADLRRLFEVVAAADIGPVVVCPHPRADRRELAGLLPGGWAVSGTATTRERLQAGDVGLVVQRSSGTGLDALRMGIPVVELEHPGRSSNYEYLATDLVPKARSSAELAAAVADLRARRQHEGARALSDACAAYGARWVAAVGPDAVALARSALDDVAAAPPAPWLLDRWAQVAGGGAPG